MLTKSQKRYLFAIYRLGQNGRSVKSTEVASVLGVTKASTCLLYTSPSPRDTR